MVASPERQIPTRDTRLVNVNEVRRALQLLTVPGQVVEIRALEASLDQNNRYTRTYGGYFDNPNDLIKAIATIRFAMGIYITLHPCHPDILHRAKNKLVEQKKDFSTPDKYISRLKWLAIDCDPERVSGISATEEEHEKALAMCRKIREVLKALGWPDPILADSGNGGHLQYRVDLQTSDASLLKRVLEGLQQYNEDDVHVDLTLFNPSRIIKLYGTLACKGDNTDERPHRLSRIIEAPTELQIVPRELLEAIAVPTEQPKESAARVSSNGYKSQYNHKGQLSGLEYMRDFIARHSIETLSEESYNNGTKFRLACCIWDHSHTDNAAYLYVASDGKLGAKCSHNSCTGLDWHDVRLHFEPDAYDKRDAWTNITTYSPGRDYSSNGNGHTQTHHDGQEYIPPCKKHVLAAKEVQNKDILIYMDMQQLGDAQLFSRCFEGQVAYDSFEQEWYLWQGHHWRRDMHDHIRVLVSGHLGSVYLGATKPLNEERAQLDKELALLGPDDKELVESLKRQIKEIDALIKALIHRAKELRKRSYNTGVLYFAESLLAIPTRDDGTSQWDSLTGKIGVKNGVLDLRTGICRDGEPGDYIRTFSPTEWRGLNARCPLFLKFLDRLFELRDDKDEVIQFLIRLLGYALTGTCKEAIFAILYGPEGRNGKSTLFKIIIACLGKALAGGIAKELLIDTGKSQHANGPKPDVLDLQGKRIAIAAETQKGDKLNISAIKHYTGGDELGGRGVFAKHNVRFDQTHTLFLHTNFKPHADPGDMAFWARACLIEFGMRFVEDPDPSKSNERKYDTGLERRIIEEESSGVLACFVRGAMDYDENGLRKPQSVLLASEAYRVGEDTLQTFMNECCVLGNEHSIPSSAFIKAYNEWSGDGFKLTSKELKKQMEKKGFKLRHTNKGSVYDGIKFVGEGQDPSDSKNDGVTGSDSTENTCQSASEATLWGSSDSSDSSLCKVPHEAVNKNAATKLSQTAVTPVTLDNANRLEEAPQADLQHSDRKKSAVTSENLLSLCGDSEQVSDSANLLAEYQALYQQVGRVRTRLAPLGNIQWYVPDSDFETGQVTTQEYQRRLKELFASRESKKILAGLEEMRRKLALVEG